MTATVYVQSKPIGDPAEADRFLDAMEQATELHGERSEEGGST
jgi:hypothetical protein